MCVGGLSQKKHLSTIYACICIIALFPCIVRALPPSRSTPTVTTSIFLVPSTTARPALTQSHMAQHPPTPLRRWGLRHPRGRATAQMVPRAARRPRSTLGSVRSEDEQPFDGVPARVIRLLAVGHNRVHPSGSPRGSGAAQRLSRHGIGHIKPLRGGVSYRSRSKSISKSMQPSASGHNRALKAASLSP